MIITLGFLILDIRGEVLTAVRVKLDGIALAKREYLIRR